jgi:hypothetical protein
MRSGFRFMKLPNCPRPYLSIPTPFTEKGIWLSCGSCTTTRLHNPVGADRYGLPRRKANSTAREGAVGCLQSRTSRAMWEAVRWFIVTRTNRSGNLWHQGVLVKFCGDLHAARSDRAVYPQYGLRVTGVPNGIRWLLQRSE